MMNNLYVENKNTCKGYDWYYETFTYKVGLIRFNDTDYEIRVSYKPLECIAYISGNTITVDKRFYDTLNKDEKLFIIYHELAHTLEPNRCLGGIEKEFNADDLGVSYTSTQTAIQALRKAIQYLHNQFLAFSVGELSIRLQRLHPLLN